MSDTSDTTIELRDMLGQDIEPGDVLVYGGSLGARRFGLKFAVAVGLETVGSKSWDYTNRRYKHGNKQILRTYTPYTSSRWNSKTRTYTKKAAKRKTRIELDKLEHCLVIPHDKLIFKLSNEKISAIISLSNEIRREHERKEKKGSDE